MSRIEKLIKEIEERTEKYSYDSIQLIKIDSILNRSISPTYSNSFEGRRKKLENLLQADISCTNQKEHSMPAEDGYVYGFNGLDELNKESAANGYINKPVETTDTYGFNLYDS